MNESDAGEASVSGPSEQGEEGLVAPSDTRSPRARGRRAVLLLTVLAAIALACAGAWRAMTPEGRHRVAPVEGAGRVLGADVCLECHDSFDQGQVRHHVTSTEHADCESCHGPGQLHVHTARADAIRFPSSADCMACHAAGSPMLHGWPSSPHADAELICSDCHDTHEREPALLRAPTGLDTTLLPHASPPTRLCASCHPDVVAALGLPSHHPVKEGMLDCTDCHAPHGEDSLRVGLRTQACATCHQEVMGPWVYDHPPVNEDCGYCHVPHGAVAESLLEISQPGACVSCHTLAESGAVHQPWAFTTRCSDCHGAVHGSYTDPHLRR